jgi:multidrug resistance efflux pump
MAAVALPWVVASLLLAAPVTPTRPVLVSGEVVSTTAQQIIVPPSDSSPVVLRTFVDEGQRVALGDVLLRIDAGDSANRISTLEVQRDTAVATAAKDVADLEVLAVEADIALAEAEAAAESARLDASVPRNQRSPLDYDRFQAEAERTARDAESKRRAAAAAHEAVARRREDGVLEVRKIEFDLAFASAEARLAEVRASAPGVVVHGFSDWRGRRYAEGESAYPGASVGQVIGDEPGIGVRAWALEADRLFLAEGQAVDLRFDALPGRSARGTVRSIGAAPEARAAWGSGRYHPLEVDLAPGQGLPLVPGMSVLLEPAASGDAATAAEPPATAPGSTVLEGELVSRVTFVIAPPTVRNVWSYNLTTLLPEGTTVGPGQPVAVFSSSDVETRLPQRQSSLAEKGSARQKLTLDHAEAARADEIDVAEAVANAEKARRKAEQPRDLIGRIEYDKLVVARTLAERRVGLAQLRRDARARARAAEAQRLDAEIAQLKAETDELKAALAALAVAAPHGGVVLHRTQFNGEKFAPGASVFVGLAVAEVADPESIEVQAAVPEALSLAIAVGQRARVRVGASGQSHEARVASLGQVYRTRSRTQPTIVRDATLHFDPMPKGLKPGSAVQVEIDLSAPAAPAVAGGTR